MITLRPIGITAAREIVAKWHRHNDAPLSGLFAVAVEDETGIVGVAIVGRPVGRGLQDGFTCEITRVATTGARNACSMLYGAARRAAAAMGYRRVFTYTLASESGVSPRAAGFVKDGDVPARASWSVPSRKRQQKDLFGRDRRPPGPKVRWVWQQEPSK